MGPFRDSKPVAKERAHEELSRRREEAAEGASFREGLRKSPDDRRSLWAGCIGGALLVTLVLLVSWRLERASEGITPSCDAIRPLGTWPPSPNADEPLGPPAMAMCNGPAGPHISVTSSGVNGAEVDHVVMSHGGALRACCERAAMTTTNLRGELTFGWVIEADGTVSNVTLTDTTVRIPPLESCALRQVESWHFPQRAVQTRVSGFPFRFGPGV